MSYTSIKVAKEGAVVELPGAGLPIDISAVAPTEKSKGQSTVRFMMEGANSMGSEPFDSLTNWFDEEAKITLILENGPPVENCQIRECSLDLSAQRLYIQIYTPYPSQQVRHWFDLPS